MLIYTDLYTEASNADWIPENEKAYFNSYIREIINCFPTVDISGSHDAMNYLVFNGEFVNAISKIVQFHPTRIVMFDSFVRRLLKEHVISGSTSYDSDSDVVSVTQMLKQTIVTQVVAMLNMMDMDGKRFLVNMDLGNKQIHLQVNSIEQSPAQQQQ